MAHIAENPFTPAILRHHEIAITLALVALLGAIFLKGFTEAIGIAVVLVGTYLLLNVIVIKGEEIGGYHVLTAEHSSIPNAIAAFLLYVRDLTGCRPHAYLGWAEGDPLGYLARFIFFGEGDIAPVTREILRKAEPDPKRRPAIHVG